MVYFFVCLGFYVPLDNLALMGMSPLPMKGIKFWPFSEHIAMEQLGFFGVPRLLWHGSSVYKSSPEE